MDHDPIDKGMQIYQNLGFAGLFAFVFLVQFFVSMWDRRRQQADMMKVIERSSIALEQAAASNRTLISTTGELRNAIDSSTRQNGELVAYLKGKDAAGSSGRRP